MSPSTIAKIEPIPIGYPVPNGPYGSSRGLVAARRATLVRLTTSDGVVGWGEAFGSPAVVTACMDDIAPDLIGTPVDATSVWFTRYLQRSYHNTTGGPHITAASGIEIAMWDAFGRTLGVSVARLLGGRAREDVTAYASAGYVTQDKDLGRFRDQLAQALDGGFVGAKIKLGLGLSEDRRRAEVAHELLGTDGRLAVDVNGNYTADLARRLIEQLSDLNLLWVEEPVPPEDVSGLAMLRRLGVPLAAGEALYTRHGFAPLISGRLIDLAQPDVCKCGGLAEARVIAHLAQTWNVRVSPHVWGGVVGQAASLQLLASIPDYPHCEHAPEPMWFELDRGPNALRDELSTTPFLPHGGRIAIPDEPGLGVTVDESAVAHWRLDQ